MTQVNIIRWHLELDIKCNNQQLKKLDTTSGKDQISFIICTLVSHSLKTLQKQGGICIENKITENQWKKLKPSTPLFKKIIFDLFQQCPAIFGISFSQKNIWNQLHNWKKITPAEGSTMYNEDCFQSYMYIRSCIWFINSRQNIFFQ